MKFFDVIGFGALNADRLFKVNKIAAAEEESFVTGYEVTSGGSAANTTVGLARLEFKTGFIGKVAVDREGKMLLEDFRKEGVDVGGVVRSKQGRSGTVMGFVDERGERALYVDPGVNNSLAMDEIDMEYASRAKFIHLTSFVGDKPLQAQKRLLKKLPENVKVSFDPGSLYAKLGLTGLKKVIAETYVFMPNQGELVQLTGKSDYRAGSQFMLDKGVSVVCVKLGSRGCYVTDGSCSHLVEPFKVNVVDTTGAGDAFCAGFLYGLLKDRSLYDCGRIGNYVASRCITMMGARTGLPKLRDLEDSKLT